MNRFLDRAEPAPDGLTPWGATLTVSLGLHLFGFILAVVLPRLASRPGPAPVYVVDLVALPGGPANVSPPPAAAAAQARTNPPPAPKEEKALKLPDRDKTAEPKKTPEPKSTPATPKPSPATTPAPATQPSESRAEATPQPQSTPPQGASMSGVAGGTGVAGGGFGGSGTAQADAETFYRSVVTRNIENAWKKPIYPPSETSRRAFTTQIRLVVTSSGRVASVEIVVPSGYDAMDRSVLDAVHDALFPPFPSTIGRPSLPFTFEIVLTRD